MLQVSVKEPRVTVRVLDILTYSGELLRRQKLFTGLNVTDSGQRVLVVLTDHIARHHVPITSHFFNDLAL